MTTNRAPEDDRTRGSVFVSYARADRVRAVQLVDALKPLGFEVWWDGMIGGGEAYAQTIQNKLDAVGAVIVLWSATAIGSDWVRDEAAHGRDRGKLVAVTIDGVEPPLGFRQYHATDMVHWHGRADEPVFQELVRGIERLLPADRPATEPPATGRSAAPSLLTRRRAIVAGTAGLVALGGGGLALWRPWAGHAENSIAVLPFANLSGAPEQAYFSDGLSEEVRAALAANARLKVAAPTSTNKFRDTPNDARTIGAQLGVSYLLEGSVRRAGNVVRVAAELIDTGSGFSRWSQTFERDLTDIFVVQREIAHTVATAMDSAVGGKAATTAPGRTENVAAYDAYLRGRALFDLAQSEATDRAALAQFDAAITADPNYAAARAARSRTLAVIANLYTGSDRLRPVYDDAVAEAERAARIAPDLADAQSALGYALLNGRLDARSARGPYERSRALGGGDADILVRYALFAARTGDAANAQQAIDRARDIDPLNPRVYRALSSVLYADRQYEASIAPDRKALALNPEMGVAHAAIGDALYALGKPAAALVEYRAEPNRPFGLAGIAITAGKLGDQRAARDALATLVRDFGDAASYQQAQIAAQRGDPTTALDMLDRAYRVGDTGLVYMRNDPMLDSLRKDARFAALLQRIGFS